MGGEDAIPDYMEEHHISVLVLTKGGEGASVYYRLQNDGNGRLDIPSAKVKVVDTTGAGDAYWGGFLSSLLSQGIKKVCDISEEKLRKAGEYGAISGGICVTRWGGIPALPYVREIEEQLCGN